MYRVSHFVRHFARVIAVEPDDALRALIRGAINWTSSGLSNRTLAGPDPLIGLAA